LARNAEDEARAAAELAEVRAIASGDETAFARLIDREGPRLLRFSQGILGNLDEAEDVVQETLAGLWQNAPRWRPEARIGTWLHTVCYNRSIDRLRRRRNFVAESALDEVPDAGDLADGALLKGEAERSVRAALERLPARQRSAVLLFHFEDRSQSEAARIMGVTETAFESLLARARRQMRAWLTAPGGGDD
jgi:RNA polymerase sigma-70 factor (ECF subfamily)